MISKLQQAAVLATLVGQADALISSSTTYDAAMTCPACILNGFQWVPTAATNFFEDAATLEATKCQEMTTTYSVTSASFANKDLAMASCQNLQSVCGTYTKLDITSSTDTQTVSLAAGQTLDGQAKCTYVIKSTAGPPVFKWSGSTSDNLQISIIHYTNDNRVTLGTSTAAYFPDATSTVTELTTPYTAGLAGRNAVVERVLASKTASEITTEMDAYNTLKADFNTKVNNIKNPPAEEEGFDWLSLFWPFGWSEDHKDALTTEFLVNTNDTAEFPLFPGSYAGLTFNNTMAQSGYGSPTSFAWKTADIPASTNYVSYGQYMVSSDNTKNVDTN